MRKKIIIGIVAVVVLSIAAYTIYFFSLPTEEDWVNTEEEAIEIADEYIEKTYAEDAVDYLDLNRDVKYNDGIWSVYYNTDEIGQLDGGKVIHVRIYDGKVVCEF